MSLKQKDKFQYQMKAAKSQVKVKSKSKKAVALRKVKIVTPVIDVYTPHKDLVKLGASYFGSSANYNAWLSRPCKDFQGHLPPTVLIARGQAQVVREWLQNRVQSPASGLYVVNK